MTFSIKELLDQETILKLETNVRDIGLSNIAINPKGEIITMRVSRSDPYFLRDIEERYAITLRMPDSYRKIAQETLLVIWQKLRMAHAWKKKDRAELQKIKDDFIKELISRSCSKKYDETIINTSTSFFVATISVEKSHVSSLYEINNTLIHITEERQPTDWATDKELENHLVPNKHIIFTSIKKIKK